MTIRNFSKVRQFFFFYRIVGQLKVVIGHKYGKKLKCTKKDRGEKNPKNVTFSEKVPKIYNISLFKILSKIIFHKNIAQLEVVIGKYLKKIITYKKG